MDAERLDAGTGLIGAVLGFVGSTMVFSALPRPDDPVDKYVSVVTDSRGQILAGVVMWSVAVGLLLWWAAALKRHLAAAGEAGRRLADLVLAATVLALGCTFAGLMPIAAVAWRGPSGLSPEFVRLVVDMLSILFSVLSAVPFFVLVFSASLAVLRTGRFPAWTAWLGVAAAVANAIFVFSLVSRKGAFSPYSPLGFVGAVLLFAWIGATSVLMMRPSGRPAVA